MKRNLAIVAVCLSLMFVCVGLAISAEDVVLEGNLSAVVEAIDRNGNPYVRAIIEEEREKQGVSYTAGVPLMFFGDHAEVGKTLKKGDTIKCIASPRTFMDRKSYTFLKMLQ